MSAWPYYGTGVENVLEWLERWAKARGCWRGRVGDDIFDGDPKRPGWHVVLLADSTFEVWLIDENGASAGAFNLTPHVAWLWAHAVDTGREVRRRCEMCEGERAVIEHVALSADDAKQLDPYPWGKYQAWLARPNKGLGCAAIMREPFPCPTCPTKGPAECVMCHGRGVRLEPAPRDPAPRDPVAEATRERLWVPAPPHTEVDCECTLPTPWGYISRPLARVVCEGAPRPSRMSINGAEPRVIPGDPTARTELLVQADRLQAEGQPLGQALALWLSGAPCEACKGSGQRAPLTPDSSLDEWVAAVGHWRNNPEWPRGKDPCPACAGEGTALAAYVEQQIALESAASSIEDAASPIALGS